MPVDVQTTRWLPFAKLGVWIPGIWFRLLYRNVHNRFRVYTLNSGSVSSHKFIGLRFIICNYSSATYAEMEELVYEIYDVIAKPRVSSNTRKFGLNVVETDVFLGYIFLCLCVSRLATHFGSYDNDH